MIKDVFVTGANGFVGTELIKELKKRNIPAVAGTRELYGDFTAQKNWSAFLSQVQVVVHLAARVHVMNETEADALAAFRKMNVEATLNLAMAAKSAGVKRFIYLSSIKVNGESTLQRAFFADDLPQPEDAYGISKLEAEQALLALHSENEFEIVIIRPPLIYGPGAKANFAKLFSLAQKGLPLPFALVNNQRSLVSVFNLVDLIIHCLTNPKAAGQIFLVSDGQDLSLKELTLAMGKVTNKNPWLLPIPVSVMQLAAKMLGKQSYADRLFGNLHVDITKTQRQLDWTPPYSFAQTFTRSQ